MLSLFSRKVRKTRLLWQFVNDDCVPQLPDATETLVSRAGRLSIDRKLFASIKFRAKFENGLPTALDLLWMVRRCPGFSRRERRKPHLAREINRSSTLNPNLMFCPFCPTGAGRKACRTLR